MKLINCLFLSSILFFLNSCNQTNGEQNLGVREKRQNLFEGDELKIKRLKDISFDYLLDSLLNSQFIDDSMLAYLVKSGSIELSSINEIFRDREVNGVKKGKILVYKRNNELFLRYDLNKDTILLKVDILTSGLLVLNNNSTKIVYFPTENVMIAFKAFPWAKKYSRKSVAAMFFLNNANLIPKFSIKKKNLNSDSLLIEKYLYEENNKDLKAGLIHFDKLNLPSLSDISLEKLNQANHDYNLNDYRILERVIFINGGIFNDYPLWSDYGGIYPFPKEHYHLQSD